MYISQRAPWPVGRHSLFRCLATEPRRLCQVRAYPVDVSKTKKIWREAPKPEFHSQGSQAQKSKHQKAKIWVRVTLVLFLFVNCIYYYIYLISIIHQINKYWFFELCVCSIHLNICAQYSRQYLCAVFTPIFARSIHPRRDNSKSSMIALFSINRIYWLMVIHGYERHFREQQERT